MDERRKSRWTELAKTSAWKTRGDFKPKQNHAFDPVFAPLLLLGLSLGIRSANHSLLAASTQVSLIFCQPKRARKEQRKADTLYLAL